jgi:DNA polymerase
LRKQNIELILKAPLDAMGEGSIIGLSDECRDVLTARMEANSTSYKKLQTILRNISPDGRLRNQFIYMGSSRCGRWAGNNVQLHNLARPGSLNGYSFEDMQVVQDARAMVYAEDHDGLKAKFGSVLLVIKFLIRTVFVAP